MSALRATLQGWTEQARALLTPLNLHFAGVAVLLLVNLYLLIHLGFAWQSVSGQSPEAVAQQTAQLHAAERAAEPLRGLDQKLTIATGQANGFYRDRLPFSYSQVLEEMGVLSKKENIKLIRVQYAQSPMLEGSNWPLTEVRLDASLSGDYRSLMMFINLLERDRMFFRISGVTLSGEQSGTVVNLRLRVDTYLRPPVGNERTETLSAEDRDVAQLSRPARQPVQHPVQGSEAP